MFYGIAQHLQMTLVIPWKKWQKRISKNYQVAKKEVCLVVTETIDKPTKSIIVMTKEEITHIYFKRCGSHRAVIQDFLEAQCMRTGLELSAKKRRKDTELTK